MNLMTVGETTALAAVSTVMRDLRAISVVLLCHRSETTRSAPMTPTREEAALPVAPAPSSNAPLRSSSSTPVLPSALRLATAAGGPLKAIWFHGSALVMRAMTSSLSVWTPGLAQWRR